MKKIIAIVLCLCMMVAVSVTAMAEGTIDFSVITPDKEVAAGSTFDVTVAVKGNTGMGAGQFNVAYDSTAFTFVSYAAGDLLKGASDNKESTTAPIICGNPKTAGVFYFGFISSNNIEGDGSLVTLTFTVNGESEAKAYDFAITVEEAANGTATGAESYADDKLTATNGSVTVNKASYNYGDVDKSGAVDSKDALVVLQSAVGKVTLDDEQKTLGDVNADSQVDSTDALAILQKCVGKIEKFPVEA